MGRNLLANGLIAVGLVLASVGTIGTVLDDDDAATHAVEPAGSTAAEDADTASEDVGAPTSPSPTEPAGTEAVVTFFSDLAAALRAGDADFLFTRLHPLVTERYGEQSCRDYTAGVQGDIELEVLEVSGPDEWEWQTDDQTVVVDGAWSVRLARTVGDGEQATTDETEAHVAFVDQEVRWFTDCGEPT